MSDRYFVNRIKKRDEKAFKEFYEKYHTIIAYKIKRINENIIDIDDLVQEVFIKIIDGIDTYDFKKASLGSWVMAITRNHTLNYLRDKKAIIVDDNLVDNVPAKEKIEVSDYLSCLSKEQKEIVYLKVYLDFSFLEISQELKMSLDQVKYRFKCAKELLKKEIKK